MRPPRHRRDGGLRRIAHHDTLMEAGQMYATKTPLYSAELIQEGGACRLVVTDRLRHTVRPAYASTKAVKQLPAFLAGLGSLHLRGIRRR
jgi:hypothetical protein